jgi:hypothetical protein
LVVKEEFVLSEGFREVDVEQFLQATNAPFVSVSLENEIIHIIWFNLWFPGMVKTLTRRKEEWVMSIGEIRIS